jgi:hypothetical protein
MFKRLPNLSVLFFGLLTAQVIASVQVFLSNREISERLAAIARSGYHNLPKENLFTLLKTWRPALGGGLFFTLSIGAGVTLLTLALVWGWETLCSKKKPALYILLVLWLAVLTGINRNGLVLMPSLYFLLIPWVVYFAYQRSHRIKPLHGTALPTAGHLACIVLLALIWSTQIHSGMFITIRDNLLLENPVGVSINNFYYAYTHYSAETISSLHQKMFKTYCFSNVVGVHENARLENVLSGCGYLRVAASGRKDFQILKTDNQLVFLDRGNKNLLKTSAKEFFKNPDHILKKLSQKLDRSFFFRRTIFFSLMIAFPIALYWMLHALFHLGLSFFCSHNRASLMSTFICFIVGTALIIPVHWGRNREIDMDKLPVLLAGENWQDQVAGLKIITNKNLDIATIATYRHLMESPHIPVRYWLARALGKSRQSETFQDLLILLHASQPNIVCQALYSIGQRGDTNAIHIILDIVDTSDHWYVLRYAYHALRNLGWKHRRSI